MANRLVKAPSRRIVGGSPAVPAIPERRIVQTIPPTPKSDTWTVGVPVLKDNGDWTGHLDYRLVKPDNRNGSNVFFGAGGAPRTEIIIIPGRPAIPATPGYEVVTGRAGWDGGARSIAPVPVNKRFTGAVAPGLIGVIFGLAQDSAQRAIPWIEYGIRIDKDNGASIVERGVTVATMPEILATEAHTVELRRLANGVQYLIDEEIVHATRRQDDRVLYGAALLYSEADAIDSPSIANFQFGGGLAGELPAMQGGLYAVANFSDLLGRVPTPQATMSGEWVRPVLGGDFSASIPVPVAQINGRNAATARRLIGRITATVRPPQLVADSIRDQGVSYSALGGFLPAANGRLNGLSGGIGGIAATLPKPVALMVRRANGEGYGALDGRWPSTGYGCNMTALSAADEAAFILRPAEPVLALDRYGLDHPVLLLLAETVEVGCEIDLQLFADEEWFELLTASTGYAVAGELTELLASTVMAMTTQRGTLDNAPDGGAGTPIMPINPAALGYAVNIVSGALHECTDLNFSHMVRVGGQVWAAGTEGLYRLRDDAGEISALLDLGDSDYGTQKRKHSGPVFVGIRTDGQVYLRVITELGEHVYRGIPCGDVHRFNLGRGLSSRRWTMQLEIAEASFAQIDSLEIEVATSSRRVGSRQR